MVTWFKVSEEMLWQNYILPLFTILILTKQFSPTIITLSMTKLDIARGK
jgi:hypothetical protein